MIFWRHLLPPLVAPVLITFAPLSALAEPAAHGDASDSHAAPAKRRAHAPATYTAESGDTLGSVARQCGCTVISLKEYNDLAGKTVKPGQVFKVPPPASAATSPKTPSPAPAPVAQLVTPQEWNGASSQPLQPSVQVVPLVFSKPTPANPAKAAHPVAMPPVAATPSAPAVSVLPALPSLPAASKPAPAFTGTSKPAVRTASATASTASAPTSVASASPAAADWGDRFSRRVRYLAELGIGYSQTWRPPGEASGWVMDCSNTVRYLYKTAAGLTLPRTASDQYYYLHLQNRAWDVPQASNGFADTGFLRRNLKPGDLLFWENTYRPERQPPITHVMIFLGTNGRGEWMMAGSQTSRGGEINRRHNGPDIYVFDPERQSGGYTTWLGFVRHHGRFCAYGRPLEADAARLTSIPERTNPAQ